MDKEISFPIFFKEKTDGSQYCYVSRLNYFCFYDSELYSNNDEQFKSIKEDRAKVKFLSDPLEDFQFGNEMIELYNKESKYEVISMVDFEKKIKDFYHNSLTKLENAINLSESNDSQIIYPMFFKQKRKFIVDQDKFYCYFSISHRLSLDLYNIYEYSEGEDEGSEKELSSSSSFIEAINGEYIASQLKLHSKIYERISPPEFMGAVKKYFERLFYSLPKK
jgi:hypothetical protein